MGSRVIASGDADFQKWLEEHPKVVIKFYADWCGSCRLFEPKYKRISDEERFSDVVFLDINAEKNPQARKAAGVTHLPYFAVFRNGRLVEGAATTKEDYVVQMIQRL